MSGHHDRLGRLLQRRQLQVAQGALRRFTGDLRQSRKADGWSPRAVVNEHRDALALVVGALGPIIGARVEAEAEADRDAEAAKAEAARHTYSTAPHARIGEAARAHDVSGELEAFKAEVQSAISTASDSLTARQRVAALLAKEGVLAAFRSKR